jgi:hypothetical protein
MASKSLVTIRGGEIMLIIAKKSLTVSAARLKGRRGKLEL